MCTKEKMHKDINSKKRLELKKHAFNICKSDFYCNFATDSSAPALSLAFFRGCERKVRAAQGTPLPKIEAVGDGRGK